MNLDAAFRAAQRTFDLAEPDYGDEAPEWQAEASWFLADREADDPGCEGDVGISVYEGPMTKKDAEELAASRETPPGRAWQVVQDEERAAEHWRSWNEEQAQPTT